MVAVVGDPATDRASGDPCAHSGPVRVFVDGIRALRFADGTPVTAASGIAPLGEGLDRFAEAQGPKRLKPDLEVACPAEVDGDAAVLLLGSGASARRMRGALVRLEGGRPVVQAGDLVPLYERVAQLLGLPMDRLNLEGASRHGATIRWYNRGNLAAGVHSSSVEVPLEGPIGAVLGRVDAASVPVEQPRVYQLGEVAGVGLAVTDAIALPDGRELLSAAAEDSPNAIDDGPVVATALVLVDGATVLDVAAIPEVHGHVNKIEGLALREFRGDGVRLLAVVDDDDAGAPSAELELRVDLASGAAES